MIVVEESAGAYSVRGADLEICFRRLSDRWQHFVFVRREGRALALLNSDEGRPDDESPPSPVLQDVRLERPSAGVVEFQLLGQAGKGIYSAAVRFDTATQVIDFDLCARRRSREAPLCTASRYTLAAAIEARVLLPDEGLVLDVPNASSCLKLLPVAIPGEPATHCRLISIAPPARIAAGCFESTRSGGEKQAVSVRWRYRMALEFRRLATHASQP